MNDDLKERLTDLAFELKKHHRRYRSSFRNVIIFYIFIIIFVLIYTTIIGYKIQELAEPRTAAALIGSKVIVTGLKQGRTKLSVTSGKGETQTSTITVRNGGSNNGWL